MNGILGNKAWWASSECQSILESVLDKSLGDVCGRDLGNTGGHITSHLQRRCSIMNF